VVSIWRRRMHGLTLQATRHGTVPEGPNEQAERPGPDRNTGVTNGCYGWDDGKRRP